MTSEDFCHFLTPFPLIRGFFSASLLIKSDLAESPLLPYHLISYMDSPWDENWKNETQNFKSLWSKTLKYRIEVISWTTFFIQRPFGVFLIFKISICRCWWTLMDIYGGSHFLSVEIVVSTDVWILKFLSVKKFWILAWFFTEK